MSNTTKTLINHALIQHLINLNFFQQMNTNPAYNYLKTHFGAHSRINKLAKKYSLKDAYSRSLDLGCGYFPRNPFGARECFGVDSLDLPLSFVRCANLLLEPIPFESDSFDFCTAYDFLEHIPRIMIIDGEVVFPFLEVMNEIYRVLTPNGLFFHLTPVYPSPSAFCDPTHVNYLTKETMKLYFCIPELRAKRIGYGFEGCFKQIASFHWRKHHIAQLMRVVK
jgi:SAM-dependent methyltransferase